MTCCLDCFSLNLASFSAFCRSFSTIGRVDVRICLIKAKGKPCSVWIKSDDCSEADVGVFASTCVCSTFPATLIQAVQGATQHGNVSGFFLLSFAPLGFLLSPMFVSMALLWIVAPGSLNVSDVRSWTGNWKRIDTASVSVRLYRRYLNRRGSP